MKLTHSQGSWPEPLREVKRRGAGMGGLYHLAKGKKSTHLLLHTGWTLDYVKTVWQSKAKEEACAVAAIDNGLVFQHSPPLHRGNNSRTAEKEKISWPNVKTSRRATCWPKTMRNKQCIFRTLVNFNGLCFLRAASTTTSSTKRSNSTVEKLRCLHIALQFHIEQKITRKIADAYAAHARKKISFEKQTGGQNTRALAIIAFRPLERHASRGPRARIVSTLASLISDYSQKSKGEVV